MLIKCTERIWVLPPDPATDRPSLGYIMGDRHRVMVDAGNSPAHALLFFQALEAQGLPQPNLCVLTHSHWDHTYGLAELRHRGVYTIACRKTQEDLQNMALWSWTEEAVADRLRRGLDVPFCTTMILEEYGTYDALEIVPADLVFEDLLTLDLGGITLNLHQINGPHTPDGVLVHIPEEKTLFLGDADGNPLLRVPARQFLEELSNLRKVLESLNPLQVIPGHGPPETFEDTLGEIEASAKEAAQELYRIPYHEAPLP